MAFAAPNRAGNGFLHSVAGYDVIHYATRRLCRMAHFYCAYLDENRNFNLFYMPIYARLAGRCRCAERLCF